MSAYGLVYALSAFLRVATHVAILIFAASRRRRYPRASTLVIFGALLLLVTDLSSQLFQFVVVPQIASSNSVPLVLAVVGLLMTLVSLAAIVFIVVAAFSGERPPNEQELGFSPNDASRPERLESKNPYEPPT